MKNKLTVNTLALGNLKQRRKQYTIMIIGIIFAMVLSSSTVFLMFSANETATENGYREYGKQAGVYYSEKFGEAEYAEAKDEGLIKDFGFAHTIGYAYKNEDEKRYGANVCWMDEKARAISYQILSEGALPVNENEVAVEKNTLIKLGYKNAKLGDTLSLKLDVQNADSYLKTVDKQYTLVGILEDKKSNIEYKEAGSYDVLIPGIFVADNTAVEPGGKEKLVAYVDEDYSNIKAEENFNKYLCGISDDFESNILSIRSRNGYDTSFDNLFSGGDTLLLIIAMLIFASCVAIFNAFNTNLKERKRQIGLLRAVGTTRRQIINIFGREALIITLIAAPVSTLASYCIVRVVLGLTSDNVVISKSLIALPVAMAVDIVVVLCSALIPLVMASKLSPMQAIRDTDNARKVKAKKIKSQKQYDPSAHIAKRNLQLYGSAKVTVSIMLSVAIIISSFGFSLFHLVKNEVYLLPSDYYVSSGNDPLTEAEKQEISAMPYFSEVFGRKRANAVVEYDGIDDFFRVVNSNSFDIVTGSNELLASNVKNSAPDKYYQESKKDLGLTSDFISTSVIAVDTSTVQKLNKYVYDGKIDIDKINSGEQVILVAPKKAELVGYSRNNTAAIGINCDEKIGKKDFGYQSILVAESPYKSGQRTNIDFNSTTYDENTELYSEKIDGSYNVEIGAIISPDDANTMRLEIYNCFGIVTTYAGLEKFKQGVGYEYLYMDLDKTVSESLTAETDEVIMSELDTYSQKHGAYIESNYESKQTQEKQIYRVLSQILAVIILCFAICASVINNSITARIRENKRAIGILRAVGAGEGALVKSYVIQMLSMFKYGICFGFGIYLLGYGGGKLYDYIFKTGKTTITFSPWITLIMVAALFGVCSLNLWIRVRKEMKNSIVENIREL